MYSAPFSVSLAEYILGVDVGEQSEEEDEQVELVHVSQHDLHTFTKGVTFHQPLSCLHKTHQSSLLGYW